MPIWQVTMKQRVLNQEVRNVIYYLGAQETLSGSEQQELADDMRADWATTTGLINNVLCTAWRLYGINLRRVDEPGWPSIDLGFTSGELVGTGSAEVMPTQVAVLIHGTAYAQKPNRVRTYLGGVQEAAIAASQVTPAAQATILTFAGVLHSESIGGDLWKRVAAKWDTDRTHVVAYNEITNYAVSATPATQRRRRIGRGV